MNCGGQQNRKQNQWKLEKKGGERRKQRNENSRKKEK